MPAVWLCSHLVSCRSRKGGKAKQWLKRRSNVLFQRTRFSKDAKTAGQQQEGSPGEESRQSGEAQADEYASDGEASSQAPSTASSTPVVGSLAVQLPASCDQQQFLITQSSSEPYSAQLAWVAPLSDSAQRKRNL